MNSPSLIIVRLWSMKSFRPSWCLHSSCCSFAVVGRRSSLFVNQLLCRFAEQQPLISFHLSSMEILPRRTAAMPVIFTKYIVLVTALQYTKSYTNGNLEMYSLWHAQSVETQKYNFHFFIPTLKHVYSLILSWKLALTGVSAVNQNMFRLRWLQHAVFQQQCFIFPIFLTSSTLPLSTVKRVSLSPNDWYRLIFQSHWWKSQLNLL